MILEIELSPKSFAEVSEKLRAAGCAHDDEIINFVGTFLIQKELTPTQFSDANLRKQIRAGKPIL